MERGVARIEESPEVPASPADEHLDVRIECRGDCSDGQKVDAAELPSLDSADAVARCPGGDPELVLRQPEPSPDRAERPSEPAIIHPAKHDNDRLLGDLQVSAANRPRCRFRR